MFFNNINLALQWHFELLRKLEFLFGFILFRCRFCWCFWILLRCRICGCFRIWIDIGLNGGFAFSDRFFVKHVSSEIALCRRNLLCCWFGLWKRFASWFLRIQIERPFFDVRQWLGVLLQDSVVSIKLLWQYFMFHLCQAIKNNKPFLTKMPEIIHGRCSWFFFDEWFWKLTIDFLTSGTFQELHVFPHESRLICIIFIVTNNVPQNNTNSGCNTNATIPIILLFWQLSWLYRNSQSWEIMFANEVSSNVLSEWT